MRHGVRLGIDPGDARIGVARSDPSGFLASPVETVRRGKGDLARIARILAGEQEESTVLEVVVGLPRSLSGGEGPAAAKVRAFCDLLAPLVGDVTIRLVDERMSTMTADGLLRVGGKSGVKRRQVIDQAAATVILQSAIDAERTRGGDAPGEVVHGEVVHGQPTSEDH